MADVVLFYTKGKTFCWNTPLEAHNEAYLADKYRHDNGDGRGRFRLDNMTSPSPRPNMMYEWLGFPYPPKGWRFERTTMERLHNENRIWYPKHKDGTLDTSKRPQIKRYLDEMKGGVMGTIWTDLAPINSQAQERLGYPTQKPVALMERILKASSKEGDVVLDPFCGCGTTVHAAEKLNRTWIGIDVTHLSISLIEKRLKDAFPDIDFEVVGTPKDIQAAADLASRDKYQFQWWAVSLVGAVPFGGKKKGSDKGIDGFVYFRPDAKTTERAIVSVKGGEKVSSPMIRDLKGVMEREKAPIGIFISLAEPTRDMISEAASAGLYTTDHGTYPRLQLFTIAELLAGKLPRIPFGYSEGYKRAAREEEEKQGLLI